MKITLPKYLNPNEVIQFLKENTPADTTELDLSNNELYKSISADLALSFPTTLQSLNLSNTKLHLVFSTTLVEFLNQLGHQCPNLNILILDKTPIGPDISASNDGGWGGTFSSLPEPLTSLSLKNCALQDEYLKPTELSNAFQKLSLRCPNLTELHLETIELENWETFDAFNLLKSFTTFKQLKFISGLDYFEQTDFLDIFFEISLIHQNLEGIYYCLQSGKKLSTPNQDNFFPLHLFFMQDINQEEYEEDAPEAEEAPENNRDPERLITLEWLITHGCDVNAQTTFGDTPLRLAIGAQDQEAVNLLLKNAAIIDEKTKRLAEDYNIQLDRYPTPPILSLFALCQQKLKGRADILKKYGQNIEIPPIVFERIKYIL